MKLEPGLTHFMPSCQEMGRTYCTAGHRHKIHVTYCLQLATVSSRSRKMLVKYR